MEKEFVSWAMPPIPIRIMVHSFLFVDGVIVAPAQEKSNTVFLLPNNFFKGVKIKIEF